MGGVADALAVRTLFWLDGAATSGEYKQDARLSSNAINMYNR